MDSDLSDAIVRSVLSKSKLSVSELTSLTQMFQYYDTDNDLHLTRDEATKLFREVGYEGPADNWGGSAAAPQNAKRVPLETFLLRCGTEKKKSLENGNDLEAEVQHVFRIIDNPRTGQGDVTKVGHFLSDVDINVDEETVKRITAIISMHGDETFTSEDLLRFTGDRAVKKVDDESNSSRTTKEKKKEDKMLYAAAR